MASGDSPSTDQPSELSRWSLQARAEAVSGEIFLGGAVWDFERVGRMQLALMVEQGLHPFARTLEIGCGALRGGYWLIHFLAAGHYYGIEPNRKMLGAALTAILEPGVEAEKRPSFAHNDDFDLSVFGVTFDFVVAQSIWTHAAKPQIERMLDGFAEVAVPGGVMLASYRPPARVRMGRLGQRLGFLPDYDGPDWVGISHQSDRPGLVAHRRGWIDEQCHRRDLRVDELRGGVVDELRLGLIHRQRWLRIVKPASRGRA